MKTPLTIEQYMARGRSRIRSICSMRDALRRRGGVPGDAGRHGGRAQAAARRLLATIERHNAFGNDPLVARMGQ